MIKSIGAAVQPYITAIFDFYLSVAGDSGAALEVNNDGLLSGIAHGFMVPNSHSTSSP
jgi:hypothetical protein